MKSVKRNYLYNVLYEALTVCTPLITAPYLSRVLGADCIGTFSYTSSIVSYFELFAIMGIAVYGQREISYHQDNPIERSKAFWNTKLVSIAISCTVLAAYICFSAYMNSTLYWIFTMAIIATVVDVTWFFKGIEEFGRIVLRNVILKICTIVCIFCFVKTKDDFLLYAFIHVGLALLSEVMLIPQLRRYLRKVPLRELRPFKGFGSIFMLFVPSIAVHIYYMLDKSMIGWITKDAFQNGYYEQALSIVRTLMPLVTSMGTVLLPRISFCYKNDDRDGVRHYVYKNARFLWFLGVPAALGIAAISDNFVPWFFGDGFLPVIPLLKVLCAFILINGANCLLGFEYLIPTGQERRYTAAVVTGAVSNVVLNMFFITHMKAMGAAFASIMAESIVLVLQLYFVRKELGIGKMASMGVGYLISGLAMFAVVRVENHYLAPSLLNTFLMIATGAVVYALVLFAIRDELFMKTASSFIRRLSRKSR